MCLHHQEKRIQKGFSLIEVLIAMGLFSVGAAGLALLLMAAVRGTAEAQAQSQVATHASELAQLIQANPATLGHFMYPLADPQTCTEGLPCSSADWAAGHLQKWQQALEQSLAQAQGTVCRDATPLDGGPADLACDGAGQPLVKIVWQARTHAEQGAEFQSLALPVAEP